MQYSDGINGHLNFTSAALSALSFDFFDHALNLQFSRTRRDWGPGEGSLSLSGTARPIEAFSASTRPVSWAGFRFLAGTLGDWWSSAAEQKMFSIHRIELFPFDWLYLSPWESCGLRQEAGAFLPRSRSSLSSSASSWAETSTTSPWAETSPSRSRHLRGVYASLFIDEISFVPLSTFFTRPRTTSTRGRSG